MSFRVLVVDDDQVVADTLALALGESGYQVQQAYDTAEAMRLASRFNPHMIIAAVLMRDRSGIELALYYSTVRPECKILLMSNSPKAASVVAKFLDRRAYVGVSLKRRKEVLAAAEQCERCFSAGKTTRHS